LRFLQDHSQLPAGHSRDACGDLSHARLLGKFKCDSCDKKNYLRMTLHFPHGSKFGVLKVRCLKRVCAP
jgi:hypothetical protein